jgi:hypothetical protein
MCLCVMAELQILTVSIGGPGCRECGAMTRVIGIEQHAIASEVTVVTLECTACGWTDTTIAMSPQSEQAVCHAR